MQLPDENFATQEKIDAYIAFWRSRGEKVVEIMGWHHCFAFDPGWSFVRNNESTVNLPPDVVEKLIELHKKDN